MSRTTRKIQHWVKKYVDSDSFNLRNPYHNGRDGSSCDKYASCKHSPKGFNTWDEVSPLTAWKDKRYTRRVIKARGKKEISQAMYDEVLQDDEPNHKPKNKRNRHPELSHSPRSFYSSWRFEEEKKKIDYTKLFYLRNKIDRLNSKLKSLKLKRKQVHKSMIQDIDIDIKDIEKKIEIVSNNLARERKGH